jgi:hypothetical protein
MFHHKSAFLLRQGRKNIRKRIRVARSARIGIPEQIRHAAFQGIGQVGSLSNFGAIRPCSIRESDCWPMPNFSARAA